MELPRPPDMLGVLQRTVERVSQAQLDTSRRAIAHAEAAAYKDWVPITSFQNSWQDLADPLDYPVGVFRDKWGFVHLRGLTWHPDLDYTVMFTLDPLLVPEQTELFGTGGHSNVPHAFKNSTVFVEVQADGDVAMTYYGADAYLLEIGGTNTYSGNVVLDGINWRAANAGESI